MNRGPLHVAYGRVDEYDDTDLDIDETFKIPTDGSSLHEVITLSDGSRLMITASIDTDPMA